MFCCFLQFLNKQQHQTECVLFNENGFNKAFLCLHHVVHISTFSLLIKGTCIYFLLCAQGFIASN